MWRLRVGFFVSLGIAASMLVGVVNRASDSYIRFTSKPKKQREKDVKDWLDFKGCV